jgi:hypothetical protein
MTFANYIQNFIQHPAVHVNTLRTGDADLRLYAYKQFKYPVPNVLTPYAEEIIGDH